MRILVTGSAGHLGEAVMRALENSRHTGVGLDLLASRWTHAVGSVSDREAVSRAMEGIDAVVHAATLHKPHVGTHSRQAFVDTNVTGTLNLLEEAVARGVGAFVLTSTTSAFGDALTPQQGAPAAWITEDTTPVPKNIYGTTKTAAEDLSWLFHRDHGMPCVVLRTARFFPEADDDPAARAQVTDDNRKAVEYLHRRVALEDVVSAHLCAIDRAGAIGFGRYIISATTPFTVEDVDDLRTDAAAVVSRRVPGWQPVFAARGWRMPHSLDRVYVNDLARRELGWEPTVDFSAILAAAAAGRPVQTPLSREVGAKGYHPGGLVDGMYQTDARRGGRTPLQGVGRPHDPA